MNAPTSAGSCVDVMALEAADDDRRHPRCERGIGPRIERGRRHPQRVEERPPQQRLERLAGAAGHGLGEEVVRHGGVVVRRPRPRHLPGTGQAVEQVGAAAPTPHDGLEVHVVDARRVRQDVPRRDRRPVRVHELGRPCPDVAGELDPTRLDLLEDGRRDDRLGDRGEQAHGIRPDPRCVGRGHGLEPEDAFRVGDAEDHERGHALIHLRPGEVECGLERPAALRLAGGRHAPMLLVPAGRGPPGAGARPKSANIAEQVLPARAPRP